MAFPEFVRFYLLWIYLNVTKFFTEAKTIITESTSFWIIMWVGWFKNLLKGVWCFRSKKQLMIYVPQFEKYSINIEMF